MCHSIKLIKNCNRQKKINLFVFTIFIQNFQEKVKQSAIFNFLGGVHYGPFHLPIFLNFFAPNGLKINFKNQAPQGFIDTY